MSKVQPSSDPPSARVEQVVAATRTLFLRYGYRRTSVDDIAREAGMAKATLYLHFAGKEDMFGTMIRHFRAEMHRRCDVAEALEGALETRLVALLYAYYGTALEWFGDAAHMKELKLFASEHQIGPFDDAAPAFRHRLLRLLQAAVTRGEIDAARQNVSLDAIAETLIFAATGAKIAQKEGAKGMRTALDTAVRLVLAGVSPS